MHVEFSSLLGAWIHFRGWAKTGVGRYPCFLQCGNTESVPPGVLPPPTKRKRGQMTSESLPETLAIEVRQLLEASARTIEAPPLTLGDDRRLAREGAAMDAWKQLLLSSGAVGPLAPARPESLAFVEMSYSEHEDAQLRFGRTATSSGVAIPACLFGAECQAFRVRGVIQPLQLYLTPSEQREVDGADRPEFPPDGACLLCIRHTHQAMHAVYGALILNPAVSAAAGPVLALCRGALARLLCAAALCSPADLIACGPTQVELGRRQYAAPHFQNVVNQPGGYITGAFLAPSSLNTHIVGTSGGLRLASDPLIGREYIDQECIKYRPGPDF